MKKALALVLALVLLLSCSTTAFAITGDTYASTLLTAYAYSTYEIEIPETVNLNQSNNQFDITIAEANIDPEMKLQIYYDYSEMKRTFDDTKATLEIYSNGVLCNTKDSIIGEFTEAGSVTVTAKMADDAPAGSYSGYVKFYFTVE